MALTTSLIHHSSFHVTCTMDPCHPPAGLLKLYRERFRHIQISPSLILYSHTSLKRLALAKIPHSAKQILDAFWMDLGCKSTTVTPLKLPTVDIFKRQIPTLKLPGSMLVKVTMFALFYPYGQPILFDTMSSTGRTRHPPLLPSKFLPG